MKWMCWGVKDGIYVYEGTPYDKLEELRVEITIEQGGRSRQSRWKRKYNLILGNEKAVSTGDAAFPHA
ncbi:hypothetical protein [Sporosarcina sp. P3]|uniref:hypothetical protein n=1 Tax=Sporosarcina sp. P3 TaxID=2048245 RepID=UPI00130472A0|nr:hypothetical protein [Sporosarcina sp. P3]